MLKVLLLPNDEIPFREWLGWTFVAATCVTYLLCGVVILKV